ncbi:hypothetical protein Tco_1233142, partial [Tanacetum coccineum]
KKKLYKADLEGLAFNLVKAFHKNNVFLQFQMDECHKLLTNKVDLVNPEGHQILRNIYEPLPLGGPPGQVTIQPQFFFNKDLEYLLTDTVMSDSEDSTVTYTEVSSPFEDLSDIGSPRVGYVPGLEEPEQAPPLPDFVPELVYPEFMPPEDEVLLAEVQPLPAALSPTTNSPGYVPESDLEEDLEEDDEEDPEEDLADYPADGGDDGDAEDESSDDEEDDDVDIEEDEEEDEHLAPVNSIAVSLPAVNHAPSVEETEPFETNESAATPPPHHAYRVTDRISI